VCVCVCVCVCVLNRYVMLLPTGVLERPLEKKSGRNFARAGAKKLIYFVDDLNMPEVDAYGTVQPHTLIRQHLDYSHWCVCVWVWVCVCVCVCVCTCVSYRALLSCAVSSSSSTVSPTICGALACLSCCLNLTGLL